MGSSAEVTNLRSQKMVPFNFSQVSSHRGSRYIRKSLLLYTSYPLSFGQIHRTGRMTGL
jgi:hypothetical protein